MSSSTCVEYSRNRYDSRLAYKLKEENVCYDSDSTCSDNNTEFETKAKVKVELCRNYLDNKTCPYK